MLVLLSRAVQTVPLETILLAEDIARRAQLCCLACRRRMGALSSVRREGAEGGKDLPVSISLVPHEVRDFHQSSRSIALTCLCGVRSIFHLL